MFCPKCGKEVPEESQFCPACGNRLNGEDEKQVRLNPSFNRPTPSANEFPMKNSKEAKKVFVQNVDRIIVRFKYSRILQVLVAITT